MTDTATPATSTTTTTAGPATVTTDTTIKPGWRTTEFWLSLAATVLGALYASGVIADGSTASRITGMAASLLAALGYTVSRSRLKAAS